MFKTQFILAVLVLFSLNLLAGETPKYPATKTIVLSGKVLDKNSNELLAGVKINCAGVSKTVYTDLNGNFLVFLEIKSESNLNIEFSQVGYASKSISIQELTSNSAALEVELLEE